VNLEGENEEEIGREQGEVAQWILKYALAMSLEP
jgi:hypothetical protein